jgi:hypothetical protein
MDHFLQADISIPIDNFNDSRHNKLMTLSDDRRKEVSAYL